MKKSYTPIKDMKADDVTFHLGSEIKGKPQIHCTVGENGREVAVVTPPCITNWPRVNGDGNYGTMWGPTDPMKAKFTMDLCDTPIEGTEYGFQDLSAVLTAIDDRLLDFVQNNQLRLLGRKNLSRDEIKMLQIRSVRPKYDKVSGSCVGHAMSLTTTKYAYDGMGGKYTRNIAVCDHTGAVVPNGVVQPGDVVAATMFINQIYTGVGGDKFGIHWSFEDVQVICQRSHMAQKTDVQAFANEQYSFAQPYCTPDAPPVDHNSQFSEPMAVL